jgi:hypothetical protein
MLKRRLEPRVRDDKVPAQNYLFLLVDPARRDQFCAAHH